MMGSFFGKIFASMWDGSLIGQADPQLVLVYLIANANSDGTVDHHPDKISALTGIPKDRVQSALAVLEGPDPASRTEGHEGRRLLRLDEHRAWGWQIVNHAFYRGLRDERTRQAQNREAQQRRRGQPASATVSHGQPPYTAEVRSQKSEVREQRTDKAGEPSARSQDGSMPQSLPVFIRMPMIGDDGYEVHEGHIAEWETLFPGVDVRQSLRNQAAWLLANKARRKTPRGMPRFITNWLTSDQNSGRCRPGSGASGSEDVLGQFIAGGRQ